jgi:hypothetical protein
MEAPVLQDCDLPSLLICMTTFVDNLCTDAQATLAAATILELKCKENRIVSEVDATRKTSSVKDIVPPLKE